MKNSEIRDRLERLVREERRVTEELVALLAEAVRAVEGKSGIETEKALVELFPASAEKAKREAHRVVEDGSVRHSMNLSAEAAENLKRAKEVLSHKFPNLRMPR